MGRKYISARYMQTENRRVTLTSFAGGASMVAPPSLSGSAWMRLLSRAVELPILTSSRQKYGGLVTTNYFEISVSKQRYVTSISAIFSFITSTKIQSIYLCHVPCMTSVHTSGTIKSL